ncbi:MAG TPA: ribosome biogenesis GTPase YlqF [Polyangiaceae bacterium]|jgi:ribosome biogenesis GTPase A|nr:ribosome biogenesis GTPase YlqF [Polyangiaceae bacterium]
MTTQWYPGHMNKARRAIAASMPVTDVIIEVLDARMPAASSNPVITEVCAGKPVLKILSKSDLADPEVTKDWVRHFAAEHSPSKVIAIALTTTRASDMRSRVSEACRQLAPHRSQPAKPVRAMVVGIPNVGKSTLINTLADRKVTKTGDAPAVTKGQQLITLESGMTLSDNPGILWPKMEGDATLRLAFGGAFPDTAMDYERVAHFGAEFLLARYPHMLRTHFKLESLPSSPAELLEAIGRKRGCLVRGGMVDMHKAADALVHGFRSGALGRITLETPDSSTLAPARPI